VGQVCHTGLGCPGGATPRATPGIATAAAVRRSFTEENWLITEEDQGALSCTSPFAADVLGLPWARATCGQPRETDEAVCRGWVNTVLRDPPIPQGARPPTTSRLSPRLPRSQGADRTGGPLTSDPPWCVSDCL